VAWAIIIELQRKRDRMRRVEGEGGGMLHPGRGGRKGPEKQPCASIDELYSCR